MFTPPPLQVVFHALPPTLSTILHSLTMFIARGEEPLHFVRPRKLLTIYHNSKYKIGKIKRKNLFRKNTQEHLDGMLMSEKIKLFELITGVKYLTVFPF
jgi:hypothetical protein